MRWFMETAEKLEPDRIYSRAELVDLFAVDFPYNSRNSYQWGIAGMLKNGILTRIERNKYVKAGQNDKKKYLPQYSELGWNLILSIQKRYPKAKFTVFESTLMDEFLTSL